MRSLWRAAPDTAPQEATTKNISKATPPFWGRTIFLASNGDKTELRRPLFLLRRVNTWFRHSHEGLTSGICHVCRSN
jgi:hypothetical protein